jgi:hypothetical protein
MAEDSGAFKTNPRNSARFQYFVMIPTRQLQPGLTGQGNVSRSLAARNSIDL